MKIIIGLLLATLGGGIQGAFVYPLKLIGLAATIMSANMLGVMSGEWQNVSKKAFFKLYSGIGILVFAIILVSLSNLYL